ncbi:hypothetical protein TNCT_222771 [Trichonephila clavata]|uniref:Uncharacterized protein n=1 Tax=Trichonephila clavata TaxID=2740835 RepID=A0A8X6EXE2_TRICU|nr:hypothetical protein TNCT_222771 [Trichonephila clavata]
MQIKNKSRISKKRSVCSGGAGIEPRAFHMQSERSTTELHPRFGRCDFNSITFACFLDFIQQKPALAFEHFSLHSSILRAPDISLTNANKEQKQNKQKTKRLLWRCWDRTQGLSHAKRTLYH